MELPAGTYQTACKPGMIGDGHPGRVHGHRLGRAAHRRRDARRRGHRQLPAYVQSQTAALLAPRPRSSSPRSRPATSPRPRRSSRSPAPTGSGSSRSPRSSATSTRRSTAARTTSRRAWSSPASTGIEKDLWATGDISKDGPVADQLLADVKEIVAQGQRREALRRSQLANGAKELLDEVATGKITGEEDRYSHTDLWDFAANVEGSKAAVARAAPGARASATPTWSPSSTPSSPPCEAAARQAPRRRRLEAATPS